MEGAEVGLKQVLYGWQIFFIAVSSTIGVTIFSGDGLALEVAGAGGALLGFTIVGIIAICVMECISEMVQMFPAPNALIEYVRVFVDPDLAWVVGIAYWYCYAILFYTQIISAAGFTDYWNVKQVWQIIAFYCIAPLVVLGINFAGVKWFGIVETIGGILKVITVVGGGIFMYVISGQPGGGQGDFANEGFVHNPKLTTSAASAVCFVVPIIAYGFMGIEVIAVSAFEARDLASLRRPSRVIAYFIFAIYMFSVIGQYLNVKWTSNALPHLHTDSLDPVEKSPYPTSAIFIIAALQAGYTKTAAFLNGCIIFSALSASNSGLYIASRTLYGLTRTVSPYGWLKWVSKLGTVWHKNRVPMWALFFSAVAFLWLPFLQINQDVAIVDLYEIMSTTSSLACFLVWAIECLAFIRYYAWLRKHQERVAECYPEFDRWAKTSQATTFLAGLQPLIAWIGMIGSFVVVFVFATAAWWTGRIDFRKVAVSYAGPVILTIVVLVFKAFTRRPPVVLDDDASELFRALEHLKWLKPDQERHRDTESRGSTTPQGSNISMGNISHPLKAFSRTTDRSISSAQSQRTGDTR